MGLIFRPVANYGMPDWLRVSIGTETQNKAVIKAFEKLRG
jgi:histidinol-phosphate aminotransferase